MAIINVTVTPTQTSLRFDFLETDKGGPYYPVAFTALASSYVGGGTTYTKTVGAIGSGTVLVTGLTARTSYVYYLADAKDAAGNTIHNTYGGPAGPFAVSTLIPVSSVPPLYFLYGWRTNQWSNYGPVLLPSMFSTFTVTGVTATTAQVNTTLALDGVWSAAFGTQANGYVGRTVGRAANGGTLDAVLVSGLRPNTQYFVNVVAQINDPNPEGLPQSGLYMANALQFTTQQGVPPQSLLYDPDLNLEAA